MNWQSAKISRIILIPAAVLLSALLMAALPVSADDIPFGGSGYDPYHGWEFEDASQHTSAVFPKVEIESKDDSGSSLTSSLQSGSRLSSAGGSMWVTISPFSATLSGEETYLLTGYLSGSRIGATLNIQGKSADDTEFSDLAVIKPDENGLFIWAVPGEYADLDLFRVHAESGSDSVLSNAIRFTTPTSSDSPVVQPVVSPVQSPVPMVTRESGTSDFSLSKLTISARSTTPKVGEDVVISGRLTDQKGTGISGATVSIDETGYPGAAGAEPFDTTTTGSDGRFSFTLGVAFADAVGLVAHYDGDATHSSADSNTLIFTARP